MNRYKNLLIYEHTINVDCGGCKMTIVNPANENTHIEWQLRHASKNTVIKNRMTAASLLASYDYLLSDNINQSESINRLKILRQARREIINKTKRIDYERSRIN